MSDIQSKFETIEEIIFRIKNDFSSATPKDIDRLESTIQLYKSKLDLLLVYQKRMRDPERTLVCDIIANGQLLPDPDKKRYPYFNLNE